LLAARANVNVTRIDGDTALIAAAQQGSLEVVDALLAAKASVTAKNSYDETALMVAARLGHSRMVERLKASLPLLERVRLWLGFNGASHRSGT